MRARGARASLALALALAPAAGRAQDPARRAGIDVVAYAFTVDLPDTGAAIRAQATVTFRRSRTAADTLALDLVGLAVDSVERPGGAVPARSGPRPFAYDGRLLLIPLGSRAQGPEDSVTVFYHGAPSDGLLIQSDARGRRSAFADDWPERARDWLPTVDDPADKARVDWRVTAPAQWRVVANGRLVGRGRAADGRSWWAYQERHPIPTYTFVVGAGPLVVSLHRPAVWAGDTVPIEVWTEPEDSAFADSVPFRRITAVVETMQRLVGPFPYEKLAHVESSTRYGGMENASAIFYAERGYVTRRMRESVVRHETSHQWFGDAVTERDFHHLWLSEGFATYFDLVIGAALDGDTVMTDGMRNLARSYFASDVVSRPVLDTTVARLTELLDANSYQKGAWVLHMLRGLIGDSAFFAGIRSYYHTYRDSSVLSADFRHVMERAAGRPLGWFFDQWLRQPGYPQLEVSWQAGGGSGDASLDVRQAQPVAWGRYRIPAVPVEFLREGRVVARRTFELQPQGAVQHVTFALGAAPDSIAVDPRGRLLLRATVRRR